MLRSKVFYIFYNDLKGKEQTTLLHYNKKKVKAYFKCTAGRLVWILSYIEAFKPWKLFKSKRFKST